MSGACFEQQPPPLMSASLPTVDRRPTPMVAIVGNDAVLAAAPATPVQLAHACLRRGFTVAVPASWGDELIAAETTRQLASKAKGPAVMCVCPYVRSRLLAPGPDLAPFLVSLVSPPIAAARYLRTVYGEHGVHITYIGGCPSADDSSIDARLTPDAFIADLAEHGIALSEQPLVFDSIVPPDRRRWCSLPGGVPTTEVLWNDPTPRTLVEIERDDIAADLAQHIIAQEPVLLDLAPSLGCACSGAAGAIPSRHARSAVTALEPPRAVTPVIDPSTVVSLDVPVGEQGTAAFATTPRVLTSTAHTGTLELVLDEMIGIGTTEPSSEASDVGHRGGSTSIILDLPLGIQAEPLPVVEIIDELEIRVPPATVSLAASELRSTVSTSARDTSPPSEEVAVSTEPVSDIAPADTIDPVDSTADRPLEDAAEGVSSPVRRRTPPALLRYSPASIPKATGADGRPLPRAYVAKRRTPPAGAPVVQPAASPSAPNARESGTPSGPPIVASESTAPTTDAGTATKAADHTESAASPASSTSVNADTVGTATTDLATTETTASAAVPSPVAMTTAEPSASQERTPPSAADEDTAEPNGRRGPAATPAANQGVLMFLLLTAVLTLGVFAVLMLRP